jgi:hypothetical protein
MKFALAFRNGLISIAQFNLSFLKILFLSKWFQKLPEKRGVKIAYLANGPSLNQAVEKMKENGPFENIVVSNLFCKSDLYTELKPNFYIICDPAFSTLSANHPEIESFYKELFLKTSWDITFFIPFQFLKGVRGIISQLNLSNEFIQICGYNNVNFNGDNWFNYLFFKWRLGMPRPTTVAVPGLMLCIQMGYKHIEIAGIDLNQHQDIYIDQDNRLMLRSVHFYSKEETIVPFYKNRLKNETFKTSEIFSIFHHFFYSFDIIAKFATNQEVEVVNYSSESFLDQFKKV